jgi:Tfp pilus assembly protein PilO
MLPQASSKKALSPIIQRGAHVLAFLAVVGLGWWLVLLPIWSEFQVTDEIVKAESARTLVEKETRALEQLQVDYGALSEVDQLRLSILLPKGQDLPNLLAQVEGLVKQSGFPSV